MKPDSLIFLASKLQMLPGITKKQSEKIAYFIVNSSDDISSSLSESILKANTKINKCKVCNHLTEEKFCYICNDKSRQSILVVVETPLDVFKFEETKQLNAKYHVLGSLINVSKNISFDDLNIDNLKERAKNFSEIIIALSPNLEGIVTANYIKEILDDFKVTQLAQGIPLGAAMEYVDELTLKASLENRKEIK